MGRYFRILKARAAKRKDYLDNLDFHLQQIAAFFKAQLKEVEVYLFGSVLTKNFDSQSDVDVLVVSDKAPASFHERAQLIGEIKRRLGIPNPFEIHLVSLEEYTDWYRGFVKDKIKEIVV